MKLRSPMLIRAAAATGAVAVRAWLRTLRYRYLPQGPNFDPTSPDFVGGRFAYAFWHEHILLPAYQFARPDIHVLVSKHADGQLITGIVERLGFRTVRGSSTRGGVEAVRQMLDAGRSGHLAVTPDGPRGPRREAQAGVVYLAAKLGLPLVPFGCAYARCWRAKSWDRFAVPRPFTRAVLVTADAIDATAGSIDDVRRRLGDELNRLTELAEQGLGAGDGGPGEEKSAPPSRADQDFDHNVAGPRARTGTRRIASWSGVFRLGGLGKSEKV